MKFKFDFYTQYNQFYLTSDNGSLLSLNPSLDVDTGSGYSDRLTVLKNLLVIRTETYGHLKGEINLVQL